MIFVVHRQLYQIIKMNQSIACCGLDCERCDIRIATVVNDNDLRTQIVQNWRKMYEDITAESINCAGCRTKYVIDSVPGTRENLFLASKK